MVQPSYPHTVELPHSRPYSKKEFSELGTPLIDYEESVTKLAPDDRAPLESHANDFAGGHSEKAGTEPVNEGSTIRIEKKSI